MTQGYSPIGPDDDARLRDEHAFLSRQLGEVLALAQAGDEQGCDTLWELFSRELEHHLQYEENLLFPAFAAQGGARMLWTECFRAEHALIRGHCRALDGARWELPLRLERLRLLSEKLLGHTERELSILHPWLAALAAPQLLWWSLGSGVVPFQSSGDGHQRA